MKVARLAIAGVVFLATLFVASRSVGSVPALGPFLDPVAGVWAVATNVEWPDSAVATVPGVESEVRVHYDDRGVPHIFATNVVDATRALGYVVARDRLFQLELQTRATAGTLSELLGSRALSADRNPRRLGLAWSAERDYEGLDTYSEMAIILRAYADGINARINQLQRPDFPLEFRLIGAEPSAWLPQYSLYLLKRMGWTLSYNNTERRKAAVAALVGREAADALFPINSPIQEPVHTNGHSEPRFDFTPFPPPGRPDSAALEATQLSQLIAPQLSHYREEDVLGSNNWAIGPLKSASGHAILAGDPHLDLTLPSIWYEIHVVVPGVLDVYGVTIPGAPGVIIGFNRDVAWSFTNNGADVLDLYRETVDDETAPTQYLLDGSWRPLDLRVESYRDEHDRIMEVDTIYHTHRGPLVRHGNQYQSLRWTVLEGQGELQALYGASKARTVDEWLAAMTAYVAPIQNGLVADRNGSIALRAHGKYPVRPSTGRGDWIQDGSRSTNDWTGALPVNRWPFSIDPPQAYLASANQQPIDPRVSREYIGAEWPSPWRAMRINDLLRESSGLTPADLQRFQTDPGSARVDFFLPRILAAATRLSESGRADSLTQRAAFLLAEWDGRYTKDNRRAVLFEATMDEIARRAWDELADPSDVSGGRVATPASAILAALFADSGSVWWDVVSSQERETLDDVIAVSLRAALEGTRRDHGSEDGNGWRWDQVRHANIHHLLRFSSLSALRLPVQGGPVTLNPSSGSGIEGASWRMVVELGDQVRAWVTYPGGQSGNPVSPRYDDRIAEWVAGELSPVLLPRDPSEIPAERTMSVLVVRGGQ